MKKFNVTGLCIPQRHYMADIRNKINLIINMIDDGEYFTINRPRQYGKTTSILAITTALQDKYIVIDTSFEGVGDDMFQSEEIFCKKVFEVFAQSVEFSNEELAGILLEYSKSNLDFKALSKNITRLIRCVKKDIVLIIDEVDKSSVNRVFMQFLGVLRNKYLAQASGRDLTFKSVILGGVSDIKNMKLSIRNNSDRVFNSPWNVAADFKVDMSFSEDEIEYMLLEYTNERNIKMDTKAIAKEIRYFTSGYPYLVSRICKNIDEYLDKDWTIEGVTKSIKMTLMEKSTLFDDVIKNVENNPEIKAVVSEILIEGRSITYNPDAYEIGIMYGILSENEGKIIVANKLFEERLYNYILAQRNVRDLAKKLLEVQKEDVVSNNKLDMEKVVLKFQEFMYEQYRAEDEQFYETHGRLLFLAYLKPILNGKGFSFIEPRTRQNKRMDVVITYGKEKYVVEMKIWNGEKYEEKGLIQLKEYLDFQSLDRGYLITFNFNKNKQYKSDWLKVEDKDILSVIV